MFHHNAHTKYSSSCTSQNPKGIKHKVLLRSYIIMQKPSSREETKNINLNVENNRWK